MIRRMSGSECTFSCDRNGYKMAGNSTLFCKVHKVEVCVLIALFIYRFELVHFRSAIRQSYCQTLPIATPSTWSWLNTSKWPCGILSHPSASVNHVRTCQNCQMASWAVMVICSKTVVRSSAMTVSRWRASHPQRALALAAGQIGLSIKFVYKHYH